MHRSIFAAFTLCAIIKEGASLLFPQGGVSVCFGEPITFICNVSKHSSNSLPRLEWRIDFQDVVSVPSITEQFTAVDREGQISEEDKTGINFQFNLTSNNEQSLVSSMTITVHNVNGTGVINNATVSCGSRGEHNPQATIHIGDPPVSTMNNINWSVDATLHQENQTLIDVQWSTIALAAHYVIDINPAVSSGSTFITTGNTSHLSILTNQEYNISVMATNCAGNGTLAEMIIRNNNCSTSIMNPVVTSSGSGEFKQGNSTSKQFLLYIIPSISVVVIICTIIVISSVSIKGIIDIAYFSLFHH